MTSDPKFNINSYYTQAHLKWMCNELKLMYGDVQYGSTMCVMDVINSLLLEDKLAFPYTAQEPSLDALVYQYFTTNRMKGVSTSNIAFDSVTKKVLWIKNDVTTTVPTGSSPDIVWKAYNLWEHIVKYSFNHPEVVNPSFAFMNVPERSTVSQWSVAWSTSQIRKMGTPPPLLSTYEIASMVAGSLLGVTLVGLFFYWLFNRRSRRAIVNVGKATSKEGAYKEKASHFLTVIFRGSGTGACGNCGVMAKVKCKNCDTYYCQACYDEIHKRGRLKVHVSAPVNEAVPAPEAAEGAAAINPLDRRRSAADLGEINLEMTSVGPKQ
jgi:hypothetical protein